MRMCQNAILILFQDKGGGKIIIQHKVILIQKDIPQNSEYKPL